MPSTETATSSPASASTGSKAPDASLNDALGAGQGLTDPLTSPPADPSKPANATGLPDKLKANLEATSGFDLSDVRVHRNSSKPAALKAHSYATGTDIFLGPGRESDLGHEAWHVVQQMQGRVKPTTQFKGVAGNDSDGLEAEADTMGARMTSGTVAPSASATSVAAGPRVAQLRGENPHAQAVDHKGWTTTAHHIVAHSQLSKAFAKLSPERQKAVLVASIPAELTHAMLTNMKVDIDDEPQARSTLRERLVSDEDDSVVVGSVKLGDMRSSFFEWQGGNQFQGPNTSIRAEPGTHKDGMDLDGKYFNGMTEEQFETLQTAGAALPGLSDSDSDQDLIVQHLTDMLAVTKDKPVAAFDPSLWTEITDPADVTRLSQSVALNRAHIDGYSFLHAPLAELGPSKTYALITAKSGGAFDFNGVPIGGFQVRGTLGYIPLGVARNTAPSQDTITPLREVFQALAIQTQDDDNEVSVTPDDNAVQMPRNKFKVGPYPDLIPCRLVDGVFKANKKMVDNKVLKITTTGENLYDYGVGLGMQTSTYLPKALYDTLT